MIVRINLHPNRKDVSKSNTATIALVVCVIMMLVIIVGFFLAAGELDKQTRQIKSRENQLQNEITEIESRIKGSDTIRAKIADMEKRQNVFARLAGVREGPQYVLNEISRILSNPRDVIARKEAAEKKWQLAWEPDNVLLQSFKDIGNGQIELLGTARSMDDIYEFWTRMKTSPILRNIKLNEIKNGRDSTTGEVTQTFNFTAEANFRYQTKEGAALVESLNKDDNPEVSGDNQKVSGDK